MENIDLKEFLEIFGTDTRILILDLKDNEIAYGNAFEIRNNLISRFPYFDVCDYVVCKAKINDFVLNITVDKKY